MVQIATYLLVYTRFRIYMICIERGDIVEVGENAHQTTPIPVIGYASAIVDLASSVLQNLI